MELEEGSRWVEITWGTRMSWKFWGVNWASWESLFWGFVVFWHFFRACRWNIGGCSGSHFADFSMQRGPHSKSIKKEEKKGEREGNINRRLCHQALEFYWRNFHEMARWILFFGHYVHLAAIPGTYKKNSREWGYSNRKNACDTENTNIN